jgi:hypothetical protein
MRRVWYQRDQAAVVGALRQGIRPDMATTMSSGPLDELVALHDQLGVFDALEAMTVNRQRRGLEDGLLLNSLAVLPFLETPSLQAAAGQLFGEPAILLRLGWSPVQIAWGDNFRHRQRGPLRLAESVPCHPDSLRDELRRVAAAEWDTVQRQLTQVLFERGLVRGRTFAIDGTGLGDGLRLVCLVCVSGERPLIVAWRLLEGAASEKGKEASVTRSLIEQAMAAGGNCIDLLLVDALYADGPLLAWLKYQQRIDVLVPIPSDRNLHADLVGLAQQGLLKLKRHSYVRRIQGHKRRRTLEMGCRDGLTSGESFLQAAEGYGAMEPCLWGCLIRETEPDAEGQLACWTLVSTRAWPDGPTAFQAFRPRWHIENDAYRELKEGWQLEMQRWGRDVATQRGRVTLTCLAFNTAQVYLSRSGKHLAARGIRRLRRHFAKRLGHSPVVIYIGQNYAVLAVEELLQVVGQPVRETLRPLAAARPP